MQNDEQVELSFTRTWDPSQEGQLVPLNIDNRSLFSIHIAIILIEYIDLEDVSITMNDHT